MSKNEFYCFTLHRCISKKSPNNIFPSQHLNQVESNFMYATKEHNAAEHIGYYSKKYLLKTLFFEIFPVPDFDLKEENFE